MRKDSSKDDGGESTNAPGKPDKPGQVPDISPYAEELADVIIRTLQIAVQEKKESDGGSERDKLN